MLKSSINFLGAIMKCQKCSVSEALHEIGDVLCYAKKMARFENGLIEYYTVCPNKCILKLYKFLTNNLDANFIWTHCLSITFFHM